MVKQVSESPVTPKMVLTGRREILVKGIAAFVGSVIQGRVIAHDIPQVEVETEFVEGLTKAEIGPDLIRLSDEEIDEIDLKKPTVGRTRQLVEKALGKVSAAFAKVRR